MDTKYIIVFCPERKMHRERIEIVASPMGLPAKRILDDSRYYVRQWMSENVPWTNLKNYRLCCVEHVINGRSVFKREFI